MGQKGDRKNKQKNWCLVLKIRKNIPYITGTITEVDEKKDGYQITKEDGWSLWIDKKYGVEPKVGDVIVTYGEPYQTIQGIQINDTELFFKTKEQLDKELKEWIEKTRQQYLIEYKALMEKIKNEKPFKTIDISGMGGGYERTCQLMLKDGIKFIKNKPLSIWEGTHKFKNIYGILVTKSPELKKLEKLWEKKYDYTGAMHQAVMEHLAYIHKYGYEKWLESFPKRQYIYPTELPKPSF